MSGPRDAAELLLQHPPLVDLTEAGQREHEQLLEDLKLALGVRTLLAQILDQSE